MAVGDKIVDAEISWRGGHCTGDVEHVSVGWILIRPPSGMPVLKRLLRTAIRGGHLSARFPETDIAENLLWPWLEDDDKAKLSEYVRTVMSRHLTD